MNYDLVIGGAGMYGAVLAHFMHKQGKSVLVLERDEVGGLCADPDNYSKYGPHIFHTNDRFLWEWVNKIDHFVPVHLSPLVQYRDELYSFPINKLTLHQLGYDTVIQKPTGRNFEEACIYSVGETLYEKFYYHYTKKMWGREPRELPASLLSRVPARSDYYTSYFSDRYVGVPINGYTNFIRSLLDKIEVRADDFITEHSKFDCEKVFTGPIDEFYDYEFGYLEYRGLLFHETDPIDAMVINYTDSRSYTREVNYKYLTGREITIRETPCGYRRMYPLWDRKLYNRYAKIKSGVRFAGRLGSYRYLNMNEIMEQAYNDSHQSRS